MPRPLLAVALVAAALAGCQKPGPAEPSEADTREAYVAYKKLAAESRGARDHMRKCNEVKAEAEAHARQAAGTTAAAGADEVKERARSLSEKAREDFSAAYKPAKAMEDKWERSWARLGLSLEPLE